VTLFFVVPLQIEKVGVKNGLAVLRKKQLAKGVLSLFMSAITITILSARFFISGELARYFIAALVFLFCLFWLIKQLIESSIYHTQFTADQVKLHDKIERAKRKSDRMNV